MVHELNWPVSNLSIPGQKVIQFCKKWHIIELALFGSILRHDFGPKSDIDVLVVFESRFKRDLFMHVKMQDELSRIVGRPVDLVSRKGIEKSQNLFKEKEILGKAKTIYVKKAA
ncbi:MAG: nucleotidyltransferase domain-containing protein [Gammaproteobacteria bacterium]|nr:nucleotidyltransferase domain-containing protein [Gammaproteobacteria bacterium]